MPDQTDQPDKVPLLDKGQVARRLTVSPGTVDNLIARGEFPKPLKIGGTNRWLESDIEEYIRWKDWQRKMEGNAGDSIEPK